MAPRVLLFVLTLVWIVGCAAPLEVRENVLVARDGQMCRGYVAWRDPSVTDVVVGLYGTGTRSSAFLPEAVEPLLAYRPVAYATLDKPGISAPFGDPMPARIDADILGNHTQGTLLDCVWALHAASRAQFGAMTRFHVRAHSEGALLSLAFLDRLLRKRPGQARLVETLVLSGVPLERVPDILQRQFASMPRLLRAVNECDDRTLVPELGIGCAYLKEVRVRPSGFELFARLSALAPATRFHVFQGNVDVHTPARFTHDLEAWNRERARLDLTVRYYDGDHMGTPDAKQRVSALMMSLVP
jgi:hypothetical protein